MKLRNKKTGEVGELVCNTRCLIYIDDEPEYEYKTLYKLSNEWEDATSELIIKDDRTIKHDII